MRMLQALQNCGAAADWATAHLQCSSQPIGQGDSTAIKRGHGGEQLAQETADEGFHGGLRQMGVQGALCLHLRQPCPRRGGRGGPAVGCQRESHLQEQLTAWCHRVPAAQQHLTHTCASVTLPSCQHASNSSVQSIIKRSPECALIEEDDVTGVSTCVFQ